MDDAHDAEPEESPYIRLPWPVVTAGLAGVLVVALAVGLFANRYLRPQVQVVQTPLAVIAAASSPTPAPEVAPAPTPESAPTVAPTQLPTPLVQPSSILPSPTAVPATPESTSLAPSPTTVATPRATVSPELATEIGDAYETYWQVRAEALYSLDASRLPEVMAGEHLAAVEDRINELRTEGHAFETDVDHNYVVFEASAEDAKVADSYVDHSIYVDLQTHARLTTATDENSMRCTS